MLYLVDFVGEEYLVITKECAWSETIDYDRAKEVKVKNFRSFDETKKYYEEGV